MKKLFELFTPDYDTSLISGTIRVKAADWYYKNSILLPIGLVIAIIVVVTFIAQMINGFQIPNFTDTHPQIHRFVTWFIMILMFVGIAVVVGGHTYAINRKLVIKKYLQNELKSAVNYFDRLRDEQEKESAEDYWERLTPEGQKELVVDTYRKLSESQQEDLVDTFLDLLNQPRIKFSELPTELFNFKKQAMDSALKRARNIESVLRKL